MRIDANIMAMASSRMYSNVMRIEPIVYDFILYSILYEHWTERNTQIVHTHSQIHTRTQSNCGIQVLYKHKHMAYKPIHRQIKPHFQQYVCVCRDRCLLAHFHTYYTILYSLCISLNIYNLKKELKTERFNLLDILYGN